MSKKNKKAKGQAQEEMGKDEQVTAQMVDEKDASDNEGVDEGAAESQEGQGSQLTEEEKLQHEIVELKQQVGELKDKYIRLFAEFDNFKKRTFKEKVDLMRTAAQDTMSALLPVLDDFDRAKKNAEDENSTEPFSEGINLLYHKIYNVLGQKGLEQMETNGESFDPELHEAITEIPAPNEEMKGKVIDTVEKGYVLKEKIIRHAKVVVGK